MATQPLMTARQRAALPAQPQTAAFTGAVPDGMMHTMGTTPNLGMGGVDQQVNALYAGVGKTPNLIDQQGRDYWTNQIQSGANVAPAFKASADQVYTDTLNGQPSPYQAQNVQGIRNLLGGQAGVGMPAQQGPQFTTQTAAVQAPDGAYGGGRFSAAESGYRSGGAAPVSSAGLNSYTQNPYLTEMGTNLQNQFRDTLLRDTLPGVRGGALAAGGVGGSRQGIAEGLATAGSNTGAANAVTNLYGQDYENQMRRNLQQYQADQAFALGNANIELGYSGQANQYDLGRRNIDLGYTQAGNAYNLGQGQLALGNKTADNSYLLGQGNLALGNKNSDQSYNLGLGQQGLTGQGQALNFYSDQRNQDRADLVTGANLYGQGQQGQWAPIQAANGIAQPYTGLGSTVNNTASGGGWQGGLGGGLSGLQFANNQGWFK
jgi:hypothetical protein